MPTPRIRVMTASDPSRGMTLNDLAEFVAEMLGQHELPGTTVVRCKGMIELDLVNGPRVASLAADPTFRA